MTADSAGVDGAGVKSTVDYCAPVLVAASHGTDDPIGQTAVESLVRAVTAALPDVRVRGSFVDVQQPDVPSTIGSLADHLPVVVVPLLLSAGFHVYVDLAEAATDARPRRVSVTGALGPDARLTQILADRLASAGLGADDHVVLAAAGSSDTRAVSDCHTVGAQLAVLLGRPVTVAFISAAFPRLPDAVARLRAASGNGGRVAVATYLLAPGYFAGLAGTAGADLVSAPLLAEGEDPPRGLVDIVIDRYLDGAAADLNEDESVGFGSFVTSVFRAPITEAMPA